MPNIKISDFFHDLEWNLLKHLDIEETAYETSEVDVKILHYIIDEAIAEARVWFCADCDTHTKLEYYMVHDHIWEQHGSGKGMLCIGCLESRMGRLLGEVDFTNAGSNDPEFCEKSERLLNRLGA